MNYDQKVQKWKELWNSLDTKDWECPWVDESMKDGNPIFSAWNPQIKRAVRVLDHDDPDRFICWKDSCGENKEIEEIVIACTSSADRMFNAKTLLAEWIRK